MTTLMQTIPKGYKQTEVGVIPADWDVKEMKDFTLSVASGKSKPTNQAIIQFTALQELLARENKQITQETKF